jgi:hypothetical protein
LLSQGQWPTNRRRILLHVDWYLNTDRVQWCIWKHGPRPPRGKQIVGLCFAPPTNKYGAQIQRGIEGWAHIHRFKVGSL